jgi:hypothetical protein
VWGCVRATSPALGKHSTPFPPLSHPHLAHDGRPGAGNVRGAGEGGLHGGGSVVLWETAVVRVCRNRDSDGRVRCLFLFFFFIVFSLHPTPPKI